MERSETDKIVYFATDGSEIASEQYPYYEETVPEYGAELLRNLAARYRDIQDLPQRVASIGIITADGILVLFEDV